MKIIPKEECMGCHACFNACPTGAITMDIDEKGFKTYEINEDICIKCGKCKRVCPVINNEEIENNPKAYACINNDEEERIKSSSGGVFSLLAKNILDKKGVVFGALIALVCATVGYNTRGGAKNVGESTTKSAIICTVYILFADLIIDILFYMGGR